MDSYEGLKLQNKSLGGVLLLYLYGGEKIIYKSKDYVMRNLEYIFYEIETYCSLPGPPFRNMNTSNPHFGPVLKPNKLKALGRFAQKYRELSNDGSFYGLENFLSWGIDAGLNRDIFQNFSLPTLEYGFDFMKQYIDGLTNNYEDLLITIKSDEKMWIEAFSEFPNKLLHIDFINKLK